MSSDLFDACWDRLERAATHRRAAIEVWNTYLEPHPYDFELLLEGDGIYVLRVLQHEPIPAELGILIGEWLYNLRATLDYVIWATAAYVSGTVPPPNDHVLQYPIYESEQAWKSNLYRLKGLEEHHRSMLLAMQPFNSDLEANYLNWINRLARDDRHRRPQAITSYIAELQPAVAVPAGVRATVQFGDRIIDGGTADAVRLIVDPWHPHMTVEMNPRLGIDPEVLNWSSSEFWRKWRFTERLTYLEIFVAAEVAIYEYDCTGQTRKESLLTDSFRAECDTRPRSSTPASAPRLSTEWTKPEEGRPTTREALEGTDLPKGPAVPE